MSDETSEPAWTSGDDGHLYCQHGNADDVHCCNCHSGFLFDVAWCECVIEIECPSRPPQPEGGADV